MKIDKTKDGDVMMVRIEGILNIKTAPQLGEDLKGELDDVSRLVFDLAACKYTSSSGLRVILDVYQTLSERGGSMSLINVNKMFYDTLKLSGFTDFIDIKRAE